MVKVIYKYEFTTSDMLELDLPVGSEVLHVDSQRDTVCLWVSLDVNEKRSEHRTFQTIGTGHPFKAESMRHLGTVKTFDDTFIWHIYEKV